MLVMRTAAPRYGGYKFTHRCSFFARLFDAIFHSLHHSSRTLLAGLGLEFSIRTTGMVHVDDLPSPGILPAQCCTAREDHLLLQHNFEIVLHPDSIANEVVRAHDHGEVRRRIWLEVSLSIVGHRRLATVKVATHGKDNHLWIKALSKRT